MLFIYFAFVLNALFFTYFFPFFFDICFAVVVVCVVNLLSTNFFTGCIQEAGEGTSPLPGMTPSLASHCWHLFYFTHLSDRSGC